MWPTRTLGPVRTVLVYGHSTLTLYLGNAPTIHCTCKSSPLEWPLWLISQAAINDLGSTAKDKEITIITVVTRTVTSKVALPRSREPATTIALWVDQKMIMCLGLVTMGCEKANLGDLRVPHMTIAVMAWYLLLHTMIAAINLRRHGLDLQWTVHHRRMGLIGLPDRLMILETTTEAMIEELLTMIRGPPLLYLRHTLIGETRILLYPHPHRQQGIRLSHTLPIHPRGAYLSSCRKHIKQSM